VGQGLSWRALLGRLQADSASALTSQPFAARDESSWHEAWTKVRWLAHIVSLQLGLSPADEEDLTQSIMLDLQGTDFLHRLNHSSAPAAYLFSTLRNRALDLIRKTNRERSLELLPDIPQDPADLPDEREEAKAAALQRELRELPKGDLQLLQLRFWKGLSITEIARRRREPYSRIAVRLFRLRKRLAARLADNGTS
jgi:RNA polymerase sigma-70 factor (ECF subfamily)